MRQFNALVRVHVEQERRQDYRAGLVATLLYNANRGKDSPVRGLADFFPSLRDVTPKQRRQSPKRLVMMFRALAERQKIVEGQLPS